MRRFVRSIVLCAVLFAGLSAGLAAQTQSADEAKAEKEFYESVQKEIIAIRDELGLTRFHFPFED